MHNITFETMNGETAIDLDNLGNRAFHADCMELLKKLPDKCFELAIVDPPYGGSQSVNVEREREGETARSALSFGEDADASAGCLTDTMSAGGIFSSEITAERTGGTWAAKYGNAAESWDVAPSAEYFTELARVSKSQIIWGGNYFGLPPTRCFIVWDKKNIGEDFSMAMCEYAWTSFNANAKMFRAIPQGTPGDKRIHPTQKPVALYEFCLKHFAKPGDRILDTHLGSGSSRIAAYRMGFDYLGTELNANYVQMAQERFDTETAQTSLFVN